MKVLFCLASFIAVASASHLVAPAAIPAAVNTGASTQYRSQNNLGQYSFGYDESGASGGSFRHEKSDGNSRIGSYGLTGADGKVRIVNYVADANGFRANVQTNENGVEPRDSANVAINKAVQVAAPVAVAAPAIAVAAPAPLAPAPLALPAQALALPQPSLALPAAYGAPVFGPSGYGFSIINQHLAPLPVAY